MKDGGGAQRKVELRDIEKKRFLSPDEAELYLDVRKGTLANWRCQGRGPAYHKIGRNIRYASVDLEPWLNSTRIRTVECAF